MNVKIADNSLQNTVLCFIFAVWKLAYGCLVASLFDAFSIEGGIGSSRRNLSRWLLQPCWIAIWCRKGYSKRQSSYQYSMFYMCLRILDVSPLDEGANCSLISTNFRNKILLCRYFTILSMIFSILKFFFSGPENGWYLGDVLWKTSR